MSTWNPELEPYRVVKTRRSASSLAWVQTSHTFATLDQALEAMAARMTGGVYLHWLDVAVLKDGQHTGWTLLAERKLNQQLKKTKHFPAGN